MDFPVSSEPWIQIAAPDLRRAQVADSGGDNELTSHALSRP